VISGGRREGGGGRRPGSFVRDLRVFKSGIALKVNTKAVVVGVSSRVEYCSGPLKDLHWTLVDSVSAFFPPAS